MSAWRAVGKVARTRSIGMSLTLYDVAPMIAMS